ncbi:hypothetical protein A4A49_41476 [Nicotiana attenuata]|uniref:Uncharacterized protein n=1 Tax=Nicotiana attenuata TaxID=49451 RepID=A0A1J6JQ10_NICAT|nr:hypothetical protein A4A49_65817 [Nicotiana attenuata]OIT36955.1 hypothetical protein A4A49_41476 [Nicotiana attenuata]
MVQEKEHQLKAGLVSPKNPKPTGEGSQVELKQVKKEAVAKVLEIEKYGNHTHNGSSVATTQGGNGSRSTVPIDQEVAKKDKKEATINWVHRTFGTNKEELMQMNGTTNNSCQESGQLEEFHELNSAKTLWSDEVELMDNQIAMVDCNFMELNVGKAIGGGSGALKEVGNQDGSIPAARIIEKGNGKVTTSKTGDILVHVDGVPVYALEKGQDQSPPTKLRKDTVCQNQQTDNGKEDDSNGTISQAISASIATVNPNLGSVYELQFTLMQEKLGDMGSNSEQFDTALTPYEPGEQAIITRDSDVLPMACSFGSGAPLQIKVDLPLKSPNQVLHDLITHQELPLDIHNSMVDKQKQNEEEDDDESTEENFKGVMREGDVSPTAANKSGMKGKKNQPKEPVQPIRILPRRAAFGASR